MKFIQISLTLSYRESTVVMTKLLYEPYNVRDSEIRVNHIDATYGGFNFAYISSADPLQRLLLYSWDFDMVSKAVVARSSSSNWRTATVKGQRIFDGLHLFAQVLQGRQNNRASGNWKPYVRLTKRGITSYTSVDVSTYSTYDLWGSPAHTYFNTGAYAGDPRDITVHPKLVMSKIMFDFGAIKEMADNLIERWGSSFILGVRRDTGAFFYCRFDDLSCDNDSITYTARWLHYTHISSGNGYLIDSDVEIGKFGDDDTMLYVDIPNIDRIQRVTSYKPNTVFSSGFSKRSRTIVESFGIDSTADISALVADDRTNIADASPILFYTQADALTAMLGDVSKNFENFFESPETILMLEDLLSADKSFFKTALKKFKLSTKMEIALKLVKLLIGGYFAYIFAIRPTVEYLPELINAVTILPQKKYEGTVTFEGDKDELLTHHQTFIDYIIGDSNIDDLVSYKATFHTECSCIIDHAFVASMIGNTWHRFEELGITPSVLDAWKLTMLSFVADWKTNMSDLIGGAESYFRSYTSNINTIGHSVSIERVFNDGLIHNSYIRSDNKTRPLDPPRVVWLQPSETPLDVAIPLAIMFALGFGEQHG